MALNGKATSSPRSSSKDAHYSILCFPLGAFCFLIGLTLNQLLETSSGLSAVMMVTGGLFMLGGVAMNVGWFARLLVSRQSIYSSFFFLYFLVAGALLFSVNFIGSRHYYRKDVTSARRYTLDPMSRNVLAHLVDKVRIISFLGDTNQKMMEINYLLEEYHNTTPQIELTRVNPYLADPVKEDLIRRYDMAKEEFDGTMILVLSERGHKHLGYDDLFERPRPMSPFGGPKQQPKFTGEEAVTAAIINVTSREKTTIFFTQGHGERSIVSQQGQAEGMSLMIPRLRRENFKVATLQFMGDTKLPTGRSILAIVRPTRAFLSEEVQNIRDFLKNGGSLLVATDPFASTNLEELLWEWGITMKWKFAAWDPQLNFLGRDPRSPMGIHYGKHAITKGFGSLPTIFSGVCPLEGNMKNTRKMLPEILVRTSPAAWGERTLEELRQAKASYDKGKDMKGPLAMAMAARRVPAADAPGKQPYNTNTKIVVFGDSDFFKDATVGGYIGQLAPVNNDIFLNAMNWLAGQESHLGIRHRNLDFARLVIDQDQLKFVSLICCLVLPGLGIVMGMVVWRVRST